jgi:hypothetical protein
MYSPIMPYCRLVADGASAGKHDVDAAHACSDELLPGGEQHYFGEPQALGLHWCDLQEAVPVGTNRMVSDGLKCYILTGRSNNN